METTKTKKTRKQLKAEKKELKAQVVALTKEVETQKGFYKTASKNLDDVRKEINSLHDLLDGIGGIIPRRHENGYQEHSIQTRFMSLFAKIAGLNGYKETTERKVDD